MCQHHHTHRSNNKDLQEIERKMDRRRFLTRASMGIGSLALGSLLGSEKVFANNQIAIVLSVFGNIEIIFMICFLFFWDQGKKSQKRMKNQFPGFLSLIVVRIMPSFEKNGRDTQKLEGIAHTGEIETVVVPPNSARDHFLKMSVHSDNQFH